MQIDMAPGGEYKGGESKGGDMMDAKGMGGPLRDFQPTPAERGKSRGGTRGGKPAKVGFGDEYMSCYITMWITLTFISHLYR